MGKNVSRLYQYSISLDDGKLLVSFAIGYLLALIAFSKLYTSLFAILTEPRPFDVLNSLTVREQKAAFKYLAKRLADLEDD